MKRKSYWEIIFGVTIVPIVHFTFVLSFFFFNKILENWNVIKTFFIKIEMFVTFLFSSLSEKIGEIGEVLYDTVQYLLDKPL